MVGGGGAVPQGEEAATRWKADLIFDCFFLLSSCLWLKRNTGVCGWKGGSKGSTEMGGEKSEKSHGKRGRKERRRLERVVFSKRRGEEAVHNSSLSV